MSISREGTRKFQNEKGIAIRKKEQVSHKSSHQIAAYDLLGSSGIRASEQDL